MPTSAQYAQLSAAFGKSAADVLIVYIASQIAPQAQYVETQRANPPAVAPIPATSVVTRALDTDFVVSTTRNALVTYTVELFVPVTLAAGTAGADVVLTVDGVNTGNPGDDTVATLAVGLAISPKHRKAVTAYVLAGSTVRLATTLVGAGTATYLSGQETLL